MKKILIIGASGFLGSHLLGSLRVKEFDVYAIQNREEISGIPKDSIIRGGIKVVNKKLIDELCPEFVFHTARPVMPRWRRFGRKLAALKAAGYNRKLISELNNSDTKPTLIFASGSLMYGSGPQPHDEDSPLHPVSFARQYYKGELPIIKAAQNHNYPVKVFRLPWLLGNGSWFRWFYLENIKTRKQIPAFGDMTNIMEIIDLRDAVELMIKISLESNDAGIFNIPAQKAISQQQFLNELSEYSRAEITDYKKIYPGKVENEVLEAYTSNILLKTKHPQYFKGYKYYSLRESFGNIIGPAV